MIYPGWLDGGAGIYPQWITVVGVDPSGIIAMVVNITGLKPRIVVTQL